MSDINIFKNTLVEGDPLNPCGSDMIAQQAQLDVNDKVPDGWRVMTGNTKTSLITRIVYRYEVEKVEL